MSEVFILKVSLNHIYITVLLIQYYIGENNNMREHQ